jgi:hypothetical protein
MLCQAGSRPKDACSAMLLIGNRASVYGLPRLLRPVTPAGSQPPFGVGLNPYLDHYSQAFASSRVLYQLRRSPPLRSGDSGGLRFAPPQRANPAYHVSQFAHIDGVRAPLYTEGYHTCVGRPLKPTEPDPLPSLGLEPLSRLSSALLRCVIPRLYLHYPYPPFPAVGAVCDSRSQRLLRA